MSVSVSVSVSVTGPALAETRAGPEIVLPVLVLALKDPTSGAIKLIPPFAYVPTAYTVVPMRLRALALSTTIALAAGLVAAPVHAATQDGSSQTRSVPPELITELEVVRDASLAAYGEQLVVRYSDELLSYVGAHEVGSSLKDGGSLWARDKDGTLVLAIGAAFADQTFVAPSFGVAGEELRLMTKAAKQAGVTMTTLIRIQKEQYRFWDLEDFNSEDVEQVQEFMTPILYLQNVLRSSGDAGASLTKQTSDGDVLYTWNGTTIAGTLVLVVRDGILMEIREGADKPTSIMEVVAYGSAATAPVTPTEFVEAADVASYFSDALSYSTRKLTKTWVLSAAVAATGKIANIKKPTLQKIRAIIKKQLRSVSVNDITWAVRDIKNGVRATTQTTWGPLTYTLTYNKRTQRVIAGS